MKLMRAILILQNLEMYREVLPNGDFAKKYVCVILTMLDIKSLGAFI